MTSQRTQLAVLGATGSIGLSTLDVVARHPDRFSIHSLSAFSKVDELANLCIRHEPRFAVIGSANDVQPLQARLNAAGCKAEVLHGETGLKAVAGHPEVNQVVAGIVGAAGLLPVLEALESGKRVLLANKEPLVMAGAIVMPLLNRHSADGAMLLPVDSEHNAIFQCLPDQYQTGQIPAGVTRLMLTASGGPFRELPLEQMAQVTPEAAVRHPNWDMGPKISVDSATMMNKGLELIEAAWLFNLPGDCIDIVMHPQSVVHSMVEYADGSVLAQMGQPDMRTPIAHALGWPDRIESGVQALGLDQLGQLNFTAVDSRRYPCVALARAALEAGGMAPTVLNAANEVAVDAFLGGRIGYVRIPELIDRALQALPASEYAIASNTELDAVLAVDNWTRRHVQGLV